MQGNAVENNLLATEDKPIGKLLKPAQVAEILGVSKTQVYRLMATELPCLRFGGATVRVRPADLDKYLEDHLENHHGGRDG
jgi:excisionase family DNA binding protein